MRRALRRDLRASAWLFNSSRPARCFAAQSTDDALCIIHLHERHKPWSKRGRGAVAAALTTGTAAVIPSVIAVFTGRFEAAAVALLAAAVAFVGVANTIFRR